MAVQCCNCSNEVTNETAHGRAPACDDCRNRWRDQAVAEAVRVLVSQGYMVISPGGRELRSANKGI